MSKSAEERIAELENRLKSVQNDKNQLQQHYNQAYRAMEQAQQNEAFYRGQVESASMQQHTQSTGEYSGYDSVDVGDQASVQGLVEQMIAQRLEPRMQAVEQYASDALQQTAGREIDRALEAFKKSHPESKTIMDFDRLIMLDASEEVKRRQTVGQPVGDVKDIALQVAQNRVKKFNDMTSKMAEENRRRREAAESKAMLPDMFSAAGFEEMPKSPGTPEEAGNLLEDLVRRKKARK
tara:strand:+ start:2597 stop:3307 length:711 start_codon:yes stop_codon:yes gene_type:complete